MMNFKITCRGCEHTTELDNYISEKLDKIEKFLEHIRPPVSLEFLIEVHSTHPHHKVTIRLHGPQLNLMVSHEGVDLYTEINRVCDVMYQQILEKKQEMVDEKKHRTKA